MDRANLKVVIDTMFDVVEKTLVGKPLVAMFLRMIHAIVDAHLDAIFDALKIKGVAV